jgi:hypothetical protein
MQFHIVSSAPWAQRTTKPSHSQASAVHQSTVPPTHPPSYVLILPALPLPPTLLQHSRIHAHLSFNPVSQTPLQVFLHVNYCSQDCTQHVVAALSMGAHLRSEALRGIHLHCTLSLPSWPQTQLNCCSLSSSRSKTYHRENSPVLLHLEHGHPRRPLFTTRLCPVACIPHPQPPFLSSFIPPHKPTLRTSSPSCPPLQRQKKSPTTCPLPAHYPTFPQSARPGMFGAAFNLMMQPVKTIRPDSEAPKITLRMKTACQVPYWTFLASLIRTIEDL